MARTRARIVGGCQELPPGTHWFPPTCPTPDYLVLPPDYLVLYRTRYRTF